MYARIEEAVVESLEKAGLNIASFSQRPLNADAALSPRAGCFINEASFRPIGKNFFEEATVTVMVALRSLKGEEDRRRGAYPIISGVIERLSGQTLGLDITPLCPVGFKNATRPEEERTGLSVFELNFRAGFTIRPSDAESERAKELLTLGLSYYLAPGEGAPDAEDEVALS